MSTNFEVKNDFGDKNISPVKGVRILAKAKVVIKKDRCKGCELCISVCPKNILAIDDTEVNANGYHAVSVVNEDECIACASCGLMCPDGAINIYKEQ